MDESDISLCGSVHPNDPNLKCEKIGKCDVDWHIGTVTVGNRREFRQWGKVVQHLADNSNRPADIRLRHTLVRIEPVP